MSDTSSNAAVHNETNSVMHSEWWLRISTIIWSVLILGCLLALPVIFDATALLVFAAAILALILGAGLAGLYRLLVKDQRHGFLHDWFKSAFAMFLVLCIAMAAPVYYLAIKTETDPLLLPRVTLSNGDKTVIFQGMMHIGAERFYKQVVYDAEEALQDGFVLYYEGVQPNPEADKWFADNVAGGDLSTNYRAMGEVCGLQFQLDYFGLLEKQRAAHPASHVTADVDTLQMKEEYERLVATDPAFAAAVADGAVQAQKASDMQSVNTAIEWLDKGTEGQRKLAGVVCRWMMNRVSDADQEGGPIDKVVLDFRNRALVDHIVADTNDKIYITYGAHHLKGVIPLLMQSDPRWRVESVSWIRPIEAPEHLEAEFQGETN